MNQRRDDRANLRQILAYGVGNMANLTAGYGIGSLAPFVFNLTLGVNPAWVGLAQAIPRFIDLFTDPWAGHLSDRYQSRFSRSSFVAAGACGSAFFFALVWLFPIGMSERAYFLWLLGFTTATYVCWSFLSVPWQALGFELGEARDRTKLMSSATFFGGLAGVLYGWSYAATKLPWFEDSLQGTRFVGVAMGLLILLTGLWSARGCREPRLQPLEREDGERTGFVAGAKKVLSNKRFRLVAVAVAFMCLGVFSVSAFSPYIAIYYIKPGDPTGSAVLIGFGTMSWQLTGMALALPVNRLTKRFGKERALVGFLCVALAGNFLKWICYTPTLPALYVLPAACFAAGFAGLWTIAPALVGDIADQNKLGGAFAGFYMWTIKMGSTAAFALSGFLLNLTGFSVAAAGGQSSATLYHMRIVDFAVPTLCIGIAIIIVLRLRIIQPTDASQ